MNVPGSTAAQARLLQIARAREAVMLEGGSMTNMLIHGWYDSAWIERSWRRCLGHGQRPQDPVGFDVVPQQQLRRVTEAHHALVAAARPVLEQLGRAIASTRYFAILTNQDGVVVDTHGAIDCSELFAQPWEPLYDIGRASEHTPLELPLWSGLRLACLAQKAGKA